MILETLQTSDLVYIEDLVERLGVSSSTVRRDVNALVDEGEILALRGGAMKINDRLSELPATAKVLINPEAKRLIGAEAAKLVEDGDIIYLDSGTTTLQMIPFLRSTRCQIVTSNTQLLAFPEFARDRVILLGGDYLPDLGSVVGPMTERELGEMSFDKAFIGANGCSVRVGISTFDMREAAKKRIAHAQSRKAFILADKTKFGKSAFCKALDLNECVVIADEYHELLELTKGYLIASEGIEGRAGPVHSAEGSELAV